MDKSFLEMASAMNTDNNPAIYSCSEEHSSYTVNQPHIPPTTITKGAWFYQELARHPVIYRETCTPRCNVNYPVSLCEIPHGMTRLEPRINKEGNHSCNLPSNYSQPTPFEIQKFGSTFTSSRYIMPLWRVCPVKSSSNTLPCCTMKSSMPKADPVIVPSDVQIVNNSYHNAKSQETNTTHNNSENQDYITYCSVNNIGKVIEVCGDTSVASSSGKCQNFCEHDSGIDGMQSNNVTSAQDEDCYEDDCLDMITPPPSETSHTSDNYDHLINGHEKNNRNTTESFPIISNSEKESGMDDGPVSNTPPYFSPKYGKDIICRNNQEEVDQKTNVNSTSDQSQMCKNLFITADHSYSSSSTHQNDIENLLSASKCEPVRSSTPIEDDQQLLSERNLSEEPTSHDPEMYNRSDNLGTGLGIDNDDLVSSTSKDDLKERGLEESEIILLCDSNDDVDDLYECKSPVIEKITPVEHKESVIDNNLYKKHEVNKRTDTGLVCPVATDSVKSKFNVITRDCHVPNLTRKRTYSTTLVASCQESPHLPVIDMHETSKSPVHQVSKTCNKNETESDIWSPWQPWAKQLRDEDENSFIQEPEVIGHSTNHIYDTNVDKSYESGKQNMHINNDKANNDQKRQFQDNDFSTHDSTKIDSSLSVQQNSSPDSKSPFVSNGVSSRKPLPSLEKNIASVGFSPKICKQNGTPTNLPSFAMFKQATPSELQMWNTLNSINRGTEQKFNEFVVTTVASAEVSLSQHCTDRHKMLYNDYPNNTASHTNGAEVGKTSKFNSPTTEMIVQDSSTKKNTKSLNPLAVYYMSEWFEKHQLYPYPTTAEKKFFSKSGGISLAQVSSWFANKRARMGLRNKKLSPAQVGNPESPVLQTTSGMKGDSSPVFAFPNAYKFSKGKENDHCGSILAKESIFRKNKHKRGLSDVSNISNGSYNSSPEVEYSCLASKKQRLTSD